MRLGYILGGIAYLLILGIAAGQAQSLKERKVQQGEEQSLAEEIAYTNQVCKSDIHASVDWQSFSVTDLETGKLPSGSCDAALGAIESLCTDQSGQQVVRQKVNRVVCAKGASRDVDLKQGTLLFQMDGPGGDDFRFVRDYLSEKFAASESD